MLQVFAPSDCGNAPRKQVLKDFNVAFFQGEKELVLELVRDDIEWEIVGEKRTQGKEAVLEAIDNIVANEPTELHIHHIITHGNQAALHGKVTMSGGQQYGFCDVYIFGGFGKGAKVKEIISYISRIS